MTTPTPDPKAQVASGLAYRNGVLAYSAVLSLVAIALISLYLTSLLQLSPAQWKSFGWIVGVLFAVLFVAQSFLHRHLWAPLVHCLDRRAAGAATPEDLRAGFAAINHIPAASFAWGSFWWTLGGVLVAAGMRIFHETFGAFPAFVMVAASASGGFLMTIFHYFAIKRVLCPVRDALAAELGEPEERTRLVRRVPLATKLRVAVAGVTLVTSLFAGLLAHERAGRPLERTAVRVQSRFLEGVAADVAAGRLSVAAAQVDAQRLGIAESVALIGADGTPRAGDVAFLHETELAAVREGERGTSLGFDSPNVLTWRRVPGSGSVLVAATRWETLRGDPWATNAIFAMLIAVSTAISLSLAWLMAGDVSQVTSALREAAGRISSGDLRHRRVLESEDELGELARSFEGMAGGLRTTLTRVASAADRFEGTAGEMASIAESIAGVTAEQVRGIHRSTSSMEALNRQIAGIAESSQALNVSVEESSSSVLELGAAGEELSETAGVLSGKVEQVASSVDQMTRSVSLVSNTTEALAEAAMETSASMEEMASSMANVDRSAEQTASLSHQVVASAERGQSKVRETIAGMDAIRRATETAERVVRHLHDRTGQIGAILDVIDDVADETNLLALNAAIIAAQAGDHGRAFGVVADEIKDLADRVLASTKEIGALIEGVQTESANAMGAIEQGTESVASGVDLAAEAGLSLEEITRASRDAGTRIATIVSAVREQAKAAGHVVGLMDRVRTGVDSIRDAASEQGRGNAVVHESTVAMREVAQQVRATTEEQARGSVRIQESVEGVRDAVEQINAALQEQSAASRSAVDFLEEVFARTRSHEESAGRMDEGAKELLRQAAKLREDVQRFRV